MGTAMKHPVPDRIKLSFLIFDIRALWRSILPCGNSRRQRVKLLSCGPITGTVHAMLYCFLSDQTNVADVCDYSVIYFFSNVVTCWYYPPPAFSVILSAVYIRLRYYQSAVSLITVTLRLFHREQVFHL